MAETYDYNLLLCKIKKELPQNKTDGSAGYQTVVNEYDKSGNLVEAFKLTGVVSKRVTKIIIKVIGKRIISFFHNFISNHLAHMLFFIYNFYSPSHRSVTELEQEQPSSNIQLP